MKKYIMMVMLFALVGLQANAQRYFKGQIGVEVRGGLANGYFFGKDQEKTFYGGVAVNRYTSISSRWVFGGEFYHKSYTYGESPIRLAQFTGEVGHYFPLISDNKKNIVVSGGISAIGGLERLNWGRHDLYDGGILLNDDQFIYGGAATLEVEFFLNDRLILLLQGRERLLIKAVDQFNNQIGIGVKYMIK